jgi:hypothetical protein
MRLPGTARAALAAAACAASPIKGTAYTTAYPGRSCRRRSLLATVLTAAATAAAAVAATVPAAAAPAVAAPAPATLTAARIAPAVTLGEQLIGPLCNGSVCVRVYLPAGAPNFGTIVVRAYASSTFYGHFELVMPNSTNTGSIVYNSSQNTNHAGGTGHLWEVPNNNGQWTVRGWFYNGSKWEPVGTVGFTGAVF